MTILVFNVRWTDGGSADYHITAETITAGWPLILAKALAATYNGKPREVDRIAVVR